MNKIPISLHQLFDSRFGILQSLGFRPKRAGYPDLFCYVVMANCLQNDERYLKSHGFGMGLTEDESIMPGIFEAIERYTYLLPTRSFQHKIKNKSIVDEKSLIISDFQFFTKDQIKYGPPWIKSFSQNIFEGNLVIAVNQLTAHSDNQCYLPLGSVLKDNSCALFENTTSGMGAGVDQQFASQSALYELIERDAFQFAWLTQQMLFDFDFHLITKTHAKLKNILCTLQEFLPYLKIRLIKTVIGDFSVIASLQIPNENKENYPAFCLASAYHSNLREAVYKSLLELTQIICGTTSNPGGQISDFTNFENVKTFSDHLRFFSLSDNIKYLGIFNHDTKLPVAYPEDQNLDFNSILAKLASKQIRVFIANLTPPEFKGLPIVVCRAISPDLIPLNADHRMRPLGHPRLKDFKQLYDVPHPFP